MFKKAIAMMLALMLAVSMCACDINSVIDAVDNALPEAKPFTTGTVTENRYESTFAGMACQLDSNWVFMTAEEMEEINQYTAEMMGEDYAEQMENSVVYMDMYATHSNMMDTLNVNFEKLPLLSRSITEEEYAQQGMETAVESLESVSFENVTSQIGTVQFAGAEHAAIFVQATFMEIPIYETLVVVKCGNYIMAVTACTWYENTTADVLANFTAL